jgi:hypothetical protein
MNTMMGETNANHADEGKMPLVFNSRLTLPSIHAIDTADAAKAEPALSAVKIGLPTTSICEGMWTTISDSTAGSTE